MCNNFIIELLSRINVELGWKQKIEYVTVQL